MTKKDIEMDNIMTRIELNQERAKEMASLLSQDYFDLMKDCDRLYYFSVANIWHDILLDYVHANVELLADARKILNAQEVSPDDKA